MKVNGQIPEIKDGEGDESQPMYQDPHRHNSAAAGHGGNQHVHEEAPVDLLTMESENQFQVSDIYSLL